jgi:hypothetical protein
MGLNIRKMDLRFASRTLFRQQKGARRLGQQKSHPKMTGWPKIRALTESPHVSAMTVMVAGGLIRRHTTGTGKQKGGKKD